MESLVLIKKKLREKNIRKRKKMKFKEKEKKDDEIHKKLISLSCVKKAELVLCYVSVNLEVETISFIKNCLKIKKEVAVPVVFKENISFYKIKSLEELHLTKLSLLEPKPKKENLVLDEVNGKTICIVPGFVYSLKGQRIGYGKGYYDKFLADFKCFKIGVCYDFNLKRNIPNNCLDVAVNLIVTEKNIFKIH